MKTRMYFAYEMEGRMRFSSKEVRAWTRMCYIRLFNSSLEEHLIYQGQFYDLITSLRLAELPKKGHP